MKTLILILILAFGAFGQSRAEEKPEAACGDKVVVQGRAFRELTPGGQQVPVGGVKITFRTMGPPIVFVLTTVTSPLGYYRIEGIIERCKGYYVDAEKKGYFVAPGTVFINAAAPEPYPLDFIVQGP